MDTQTATLNPLVWKGDPGLIGKIRASAAKKKSEPEVRRQ